METSDNGTEVKAQLDAKEAAFLEFRVEEYRRRVKAHPTDYELKMRYGRVLMEKGLPNEAIEQFQKAVKDPKYKVGALSMLGSCFEAKKMYDLARNQYTEALKDVADADSELAKEIKYNLGVVAEKKGEVETAMKWYQEIMAVDISYNDVASRVEKLMEQSQ